jgi:hypothetical protein
MPADLLPGKAGGDNPGPPNLVTLITGPPRSGSSCVTGILECCGFDLGQRVRVLRKGTVHNPRGHLEPDLLFTINDRLLFEASRNRRGIMRLLSSRTRGAEGDIACIPDSRPLADLAAKRTNYFQLFVEKFDGDLCKDPLMCLTLPVWELHWPALRQVVFCLRHPLAVARSMEKRYGMVESEGLELWHNYASRFLGGVKRCRVVVFDFDAFLLNPVTEISALLRRLERTVPHVRVQTCVDEVFDSKDVHWSREVDDMTGMPAAVRDLYTQLRSRSS